MKTKKCRYLTLKDLDLVSGQYVDNGIEDRVYCFSHRNKNKTYKRKVIMICEILKMKWDNKWHARFSEQCAIGEETLTLIHAILRHLNTDHLFIDKNGDLQCANL